MRRVMGPWDFEETSTTTGCRVRFPTLYSAWATTGRLISRQSRARKIVLLVAIALIILVISVGVAGWMLS